MNTMVTAINQDKREQMMVNMMPMMMDGIDMNEFMPKMLAHMLKDLSADDIITFIKELVDDSSKLTNFANKIAEANLMSKMMMKTWESKLSFNDTVEALNTNAPKNNWRIPDIRDLQQLWKDGGVSNPPRIKILYFCNASGGYTITKDDELKAMSVMMPMGVSVYETSTGNVEIAAMNLGMMSGLFAGEVKQTLSDSSINFDNCLKDIVR